MIYSPHFGTACRILSAAEPLRQLHFPQGNQGLGRRREGLNTYIIVVKFWLFNIAMENGPFIDGLPIEQGDFPWLC